MHLKRVSIRSELLPGREKYPFFLEVFQRTSGRWSSPTTVTFLIRRMAMAYRGFSRGITRVPELCYCKELLDELHPLPPTCRGRSECPLRGVK